MPIGLEDRALLMPWNGEDRDASFVSSHSLGMLGLAASSPEILTSAILAAAS